MRDLSKCYACGVQVKMGREGFWSDAYYAYEDKKWCSNCHHHAERYAKRQNRIKNPGPIESRFDILDIR